MSSKATHMARSHRSYKEKQQILSNIDRYTAGGQGGRLYAADNWLRLKDLFNAFFSRKAAK